MKKWGFSVKKETLYYFLRQYFDNEIQYFSILIFYIFISSENIEILIPWRISNNRLRSGNLEIAIIGYARSI